MLRLALILSLAACAPSEVEVSVIRLGDSGPGDPGAGDPSGGDPGGGDPCSATEACFDGVDNDCDGVVDEDCPEPPVNVTMVSRLTHPQANTYHGVWGYEADGRELVVVAADTGLWVREPAGAVDAFFDGGGSTPYRDVVSFGTRIYSVSQVTSGIRVIDMSNPDQPTDEGTILAGHWLGAHTLTVDTERGHLYVQGARTAGAEDWRLFVIDVSATPAVLATYDGRGRSGGPAGVVHVLYDTWVENGRLYVTEQREDGARLRVLDVEDPAAIDPDDAVAEIFGPFAGQPHSAWVSQDEELLVVPCEAVGVDGGDMAKAVMWDISGLREDPPSPPRLLNIYGHAPHTLHNLLGSGRTGYAAHFTDGFHLVDLADPTFARRLAHFDTTDIVPGSHLGPNLGEGAVFASYYGAWDVYPYQDSGMVYVTDVINGVFVLQVDVGQLNRRGDGQSGANGVPRMSAPLGPPVAGRDFVLEVEALAPCEPFQVEVATDDTFAPLLHTLAGVADASGRGRVTLALADPPAGGRLWARAVQSAAGAVGTSRDTWFGVALLPWEELEPDYSNIRGLNFIPDYPTLSANPPQLPAPLEYRGAASGVAIWRFYQSADVEQQLRHVSALGANAVRVWLSHAVWETEGQGFIDKLVDFMELAAKHRLYVMPILFDSCFVEPTAGSEYDDIGIWVKNPSTADTAPGSDFRTRAGGGDEYVTAVVDAVGDSPALLMWDIMNEPQSHEFVEHYVELVKALDPDTPTTVGFAAIMPDAEGPLFNPLIDHPDLDVLSFHPYGIFRQNYAEWTRGVRAVNAARNDPPKPMLSTEGGSPGIFQLYQDHLDYIAREGEENGGPVGFFLFQAIIGDKNLGAPFKEGGGFLFPDGEVRDLPAAMAFRRVAFEQGVVSLPVPMPKAESDPTYFPYPIDPPMGADEVVAILADWANLRAAFSDENLLGDGYVFQGELMTWVTVSLNYLGPGDNRGVLTEVEHQIVVEWADLARSRDLFDPANYEALAAEGWVIFGENGATIVWSKYDEMFEAWGEALYEIIDAHELGG